MNKKTNSNESLNESIQQKLEEIEQKKQKLFETINKAKMFEVAFIKAINNTTELNKRVDIINILDAMYKAGLKDGISITLNTIQEDILEENGIHGKN